MFSPDTVFVVGAGASCEVGLPSGDSLRNHIISELSVEGHHRFESEAIRNAVNSIARKDGQEVTDYLQAAERIRLGLPLASSIDNYLNEHPDPYIEKLGKLAIASVILKSERASALAGQNTPWEQKIGYANVSAEKVTSSWYIPLMRLLTSGRTRDDLEEIFDNVAFIVFNYDRCLEHFLINALMTYYTLSADDAIDACRRLNIVHPYGQVGHLQWQGGVPVAPFGSDDCNLVQVAEQIRTFTESAVDGTTDRVDALMSDAKTVIFMGFGFLEQNRNLLSVTSSSARRVFATTYEVSATDAQVIERNLFKMLGGYMDSEVPAWKDYRAYESVMLDCTCRQLLDSNRHALAEPFD